MNNFYVTFFQKKLLSNEIKLCPPLQAMLDVLESCHVDTIPTLEILETIDIHPRIQGLQDIKL